MNNLSLYAVLVPIGSSSPSHTLSSSKGKIETDIINCLYQSLNKSLNSHEMVGAWVFDNVEIDEKEWKKAGIALLQSLAVYNSNRIYDIFYEVYLCMGKSQYQLPMISIKRKNISYYRNVPRLNNYQNPRFYTHQYAEINLIKAKSVSLELLESGKVLIDPKHICSSNKKSKSKKHNTECS